MTPGNYDGVHIGHQALLRAARELAGDRRVVALTFDPHPAQVLAPGKAPPLLTTPARRAELLRACGADEVVVQRFDAEFAAHTPEQFVQEVLRDRLDAEGVVVGPDFRFGRGRAGDVARLRALGAGVYDVLVVEPCVLDGEVVSSTRVRAALRAGDLRSATQLLGRVHDTTAAIVRGDGRGRSIGVPTANLDLAEPVLLPADGVYAVVARMLDGGPEILRGVANLGVRPTFGAGRSVEVHLLDFDADLYDRRLRVGFVERLRGEQRFDGVAALKAQIARDVEAARTALDAADHAAWRSV